MTLYFLFRFRGSEFIDTLEHEHVDDLAALDAARSLCSDHTVELYEANRFVARVKQAEKPITVRDDPSSDLVPGQYADDTFYQWEMLRGRVQERQRLSLDLMANSREAGRQSIKAIEQSRETLVRIGERGWSFWDPDAKDKMP